MIPGAGGSAWYWHLVEPTLRQRGYEAVAVALPAADDSAGVVAYASAVVRAGGKRESRRWVRVAQSLGGFTTPVLCERIAVSPLVTVNAMAAKPDEMPCGGGGTPATPALAVLRQPADEA